jgi:hypothetical protein
VPPLCYFEKNLPEEVVKNAISDSVIIIDRGVLVAALLYTVIQVREVFVFIENKIFLESVTGILTLAFLFLTFLIKVKTNR